MKALFKIRSLLENLSAAEVAELFLSPYVSPSLLNEATRDEGPSLWIVNRSDVYNETLKALTSHPLNAIAQRASEKLAARRTQLILLSPPEVEGPFEEIPEYAIEDLLGHPLAPFEGILYFSRSLNEDVRASSALSLVRRLLEHPPNWNAGLQMKGALIDAFGKLLYEDPSPLVRSYAARIPLFPSSLIEGAFEKEKVDLVQGRLLQNPSSTQSLIEGAAQRESLFCLRIASLDSRLPQELRKKLRDSQPDPLLHALQEYYLES